MPKLSDIRRIIPEDFDAEQQELVEGIAGSYNEFADEVYGVINGQLDFENLARAKVSLEITFDATGKPINSSSISVNLASVSMIHIGKVQNVTNASARLTQLPYIDWSFQGGGIIKINYGVGFTAGNKYRLTLEIIQ
jgi:hypothetical protein